jgi:DNA-binding NtrC family response regulator
MPELGAESEPMRLLLVVRPTPEGKELREALGQRMPELRVDQAEGVYSGLAHLFESPPDVLVIDASLPGVDVTVLRRELSGMVVGSKLRVIVIRPVDMASLDDSIREAGAWSVLDAPVTADDVCESLSLGNLDVTRTKAS